MKLVGACKLEHLYTGIMNYSLKGKKETDASLKENSLAPVLQLYNVIPTHFSHVARVHVRVRMPPKLTTWWLVAFTRLALVGTIIMIKPVHARSLQLTSPPISTSDKSDNDNE